MKDKYKYQTKYKEKVGMIYFKISLNPATEQDLIEAIRSQGKQYQAQYIKRLIREDIRRKEQMKELYVVVEVINNDEEVYYRGYDLEQAREVLIKYEQYGKVEIRKYVLSREFDLDPNSDDYEEFMNEFLAGGVYAGYDIIS